MKLALLSNVTMDILAGAVSHDVYLPEGYDTWQLEVLNEASALNTGDFNAVFVFLHCKDAKKSWREFADGAAALDGWLGVLSSGAERNPGTQFFIADLDIPADAIRPVRADRPERDWEHHWQSGVRRLGRELPNVCLFDLKSIVEDMGRDAFYSPKLWYAAGMPYSLKAVKAIAGEMELLLNTDRKKVLITDLDNTLWGGVVGEDGVDGLILSAHKEGARFRDFQLRLKELGQTGALLAIVSKNNAEDALAAIDGHPDMALRSEDFAAMKINWESKADNIRELAEELNLGLDSMVFIDDNPLERELVKRELPEVVTVDFPADTALLEKTALDIYRRYFRPLRITAEDGQKALMYRQEGERRRLHRAAATPEDYIRALEIEAAVRRMTPEETDRVAQLCNKTNQFNLTTRRYGRREIMSMADDDACRVLTLRSRDRYGDNGLVGVMIVKERGGAAEIDTFLLSCRVMGRQLEDHVFKAAAMYYKARGFSRMTGLFIPTAKNKPVERLYDRLGFDAVLRSPERTEYVFDLSKAGPWESVYKSFTAELD